MSQIVNFCKNISWFRKKCVILRRISRKRFGSVCSFYTEIGHRLLTLITNPKVKANMDIPLAIKDIGNRNGLMGYERNSSTFCLTTEDGGLSGLNHLMI